MIFQRKVNNLTEARKKQSISMKKIGEHIKTLRTNANLSADELAKKLGRTGSNRKQFVYDIEAGRVKKIDIELFGKLGEIFKVPLSYFISSEVNGKISGEMELLTGDEIRNQSYWKEKYDYLMQENSRLKDQIIKLLESK